MRRALVIAAFIALAGAAVALVQKVLELRVATAPPTPEAYVNASWVVYKHGPGHRTHVGRLRLDCSACHRSHATGAFDRPGPAPCASCHEARGDIRHEQVSLGADDRVLAHGPGARQLSNCLACHGFGPDPEQSPKDCMGCHDRAHGEVGRIVTHDDAPCTECHDVHDNAVRPLPCTQCHEQEVRHAHPAADVASQCRDCHDVHAPSSFATAQCQTCHGAEGEHPVPARATFGQHTCTGCHQAHAFEKEQAAPCQSCHADLGTLHDAEKPCTSCHDPHAVRESVRGASPCASCHADVTPEHAGSAHAEADACTSCHAPHPASPSEAHARDRCTGCHTDVGGAAHTAHAASLACTSCHTPHGFELEGAQGALCQRCHAEEHKAFARQGQHASCAGCHAALPHGPDLAPKACASCHSDEGHAVAQGHASCTGCHEPHGTQVAKGRCESCHADEAEHHPRGHQVCTSCHTPHSGAALPGVADCSSCHVAARLPGLHQVKEHAQSCQSCHAPHGSASPAGRPACLACHEDRTAHEPEAALCSGCHAFIGPKPRRGAP